MRIKTKNYLYFGLVLAVISILVFQGYLFYDLKREFNDEVESLQGSILALDSKIDSQKNELDNKIGNLRNESADRKSVV